MQVLPLHALFCRSKQRQASIQGSAMSLPCEIRETSPLQLLQHLIHNLCAPHFALPELALFCTVRLVLVISDLDWKTSV